MAAMMQALTFSLALVAEDDSVLPKLPRQVVAAMADGAAAVRAVPVTSRESLHRDKEGERRTRI